MAKRNRNRTKIVNSDPQYQEALDSRRVRSFRQYSTPIFSKITPKQRASLTRQPHIWRIGDKFYKLADKHYGDSSLWWVIAWYNTTPTEAHVKPGDTVRIPFPLETVLRMLKVF
tara:strand:- start:679 stop:1020 length:342 start_codon:yes stop_codon:yes gene_type:complete